MRQLGETRDPRGLVSGSPGEVRRTADTMAKFGAALSSAGEGLRKIDAGGWNGPAADGFHESFDGEPGRWIECGDAFEDAAGAVSSYSHTLEWAQGQAAEAIVLWDEGEAATKTAKAEHEAAVQRAQQDAVARTTAGVSTVAPDIPFHDPGEEKRQAARDKLQRARRHLDETGDRAEVTVGHARDKAPPKPKWWQKVGEFLSEFGKGAWEATVGLVEFAWSISTIRMLVDPVGYAQTVASYVGTAQFAVQHPGEFAKAVVDWDTWKENPARALGRLVPDIALAAATAGAGAAAKGARGMKALDNLADGAKNTPNVRRAISVDDLSPQQAANYTRYEKKLPSKHEPVRVENLPDGSVRMSAKVPADNIPGSYAEYIKVVDKDGNTVQYVKDTYGPDGQLIHSKPKM